MQSENKGFITSDALKKMAKIQNSFLKVQFAVILFVFCVKCANGDLRQIRLFDSFDFDFESIFAIKEETKFDSNNLSKDDFECEKELNAIGSALKTRDFWAIKSKQSKN